jgi:ribonucleotide monophosphatase NagD (HAD superfamily)
LFANVSALLLIINKALSYLQTQRIPFVLLTNGGGRHESERVAELSSKLGVAIDTSMFVQSHTPFAEMEEFKDNKTVLVVGGEADNCRKVAELYGFKTVVTPADILTAYVMPGLEVHVKHILTLYTNI